MSFENDFFDIVVSNYGINNVQDITKTWSEVVRVTKPGAQILFTMYKQEAYFDFYEILAEVFEVMLLKKELRQLKSQQVVAAKREAQIEKVALKSGLRLVSCDKHQWQWKFASGAAFLNHAWIKEVFFPIWFDLIRPYNQSCFLKLIEDRLDKIVNEKGTLIFNISYSIYEMEKK
jgi:ubiquinone/menaquinone biosynthesis C-methylase UbiE